MPKKPKEMQFYQAVGRRKDAVARVRLYITGKEKSATVAGKKINQGDFLINDKPLNMAFTNPVDQKRAVIPLTLTNSVDRFAISVKLNGGGMNGQLEAMMHGIARALLLVNEE